MAGRFLVLVPSGGMTGVSRKLSERERARLKNIVSKIAPKDMGVIIRTAAEGASEEAITKDLENLVRQWERITASATSSCTASVRSCCKASRTWPSAWCATSSTTTSPR